MQKKRYVELDALRGLAAVLVVFFHFTMGRKEALSGFELGVTGVDLFFIISGFVIFMSVDKMATAREFVIGRFSRLYPTYWTCVTLTFLLVLLSEYILSRKTIGLYPIWLYATNMTMFQYYLGVSDLDGPYWTMIIEIIFYVVILVLFISNQLKNVEWWGIGGLALVVIYDYVLVSFCPNVYHILAVWFPLINHLPLFYAGILFFRISTEKTSYIRRYTLIVLCCIIQIGLYDNGGQSRLFISHAQYSTMLLIYFALFIAFIHGKLRFIVNPITLYLGTISYALYLIHQYLGVHILIPRLTLWLGMNFWIAILISLIICILIAGFITTYIEAPMRVRIKEVLSSGKFKAIQVKV
ncbi:acyltransferase [Cytophagaceae bacterium DM2B3-1]|uniref:Acyltransferase n=1 Tax=Xanthocytophaga flava TaxID=3048013 RepID=A0ABT7CIH4_9BACT|nr:acyltransferase [Xanthocytophaga flavus]MDJ1493543.1 acyltransferase [Xanthocytophaga flavus]